MMTTDNKKDEVMNKEQVEVVDAQVVDTEITEVEKPEKKKINWKNVGKKLAIGAGAAVALVAAFGGGYETGKHSVKKSGSQDSSAQEVEVTTSETANED